MNTLSFKLVASVVMIALTMPAIAQKQYDPGASDTEIRIGNLSPRTGWLSEYGATARAEAAYFQMINDRGGINGRKINFLSVDTQSSVRTAIELTHRLVERDQVMLMFGSTGATANVATRIYLNAKKVPQLFVASPISKMNDPAHFPWTIGFQPSGKTEAAIYSKYVLKNMPAAKIAILYGDDEVGRDMLAGVHEALADKASGMIVKEVSYDDQNPYLDSQIPDLKNSGADVFFNFSVGKYATLAIQSAYDAGWRPTEFIPNASLSVKAFIEPAGMQKSVGIITSGRSRGWLTPTAQADPQVRDFLDWMKQYNPDASLRDQMNVYGYEVAETLCAVLKNCGDNLTRANVLKQATSLDLEIGMLLPGIRVQTSPTDYRPIRQLYLMRFNGRGWAKFGDVIGG